MSDDVTVRIGMGAALGLAAVAITGSFAQPATNHSSHLSARPAADMAVHRRVVLGYSVQHRPIVARELGDPTARNRVLVVGCIHGNEQAGMAITTDLLRKTMPPGIDLWVIQDLNPDGVAHDTRGNGRGVDLNRNFSYRWRVLGPPGSTYYSGRRPFSEPESRLAARLIRSLRPTLSIWYHQHMDVVDASEGPVGLVRRYAADVHMRVARLFDEPGSSTSYENHRRPHTAFVVELPAGRLTSAAAARHARAVLDIARRAG